MDKILGEWLDTDAKPRVVVAIENARLLWANEAARAFLARRRDLEIRGAALVAINSVENELLFKEICALTEGPRVWELPSAEDSDIVMELRRIQHAEQSFAAITFWRAEGPRFADLARLFGLTRAERSVLFHLLDGNVADIIAEKNCVTLDTVRTQIRSIYAKLDVSSRER